MFIRYENRAGNPATRGVARDQARSGCHRGRGLKRGIARWLTIMRGGKPTIQATAIKELKEQGLVATEIARRLGIGRASVYRVLDGLA
jgi:AcrR family transcriptional regulator